MKHNATPRTCSGDGEVCTGGPCTEDFATCGQSQSEYDDSQQNLARRRP